MHWQLRELLASPLSDRLAKFAAEIAKELEGLNGAYTYDGSGDNVRQEPRLLVYGPNGFDTAK